MTDDQPNTAKRRRWPWVVLFFLIAIPAGLTLAGVLTSPPRAAYVPVGRIVYLEADEPSDHTTLLRGLRITLPGKDGSRELLHETEPQDADAGSRDWFTQPKASPDGHWLAYEKQVITLQEEQQSVVNQLWVLELDAPHARPRLLLDLTAAHLKQFVGLAWTPDSKQVVFLNDARACLVSVTDGKLTYRPFVQPLSLSPNISATKLPMIYENRIMSSYIEINHGATKGTVLLDVSSPDQSHIANTVLREPNPRNEANAFIHVGDNHTSINIHPRWGWSVFGGRHITSLRWSPDGKYLGYTVSKPPFEDELFYADIATGKCYQLPIRTGHAAWDWTR